MAVETLVPKDLHLRPEEVQQVTAERLVPAKMNLRSEECIWPLLKCWCLQKCT